MTACVFIGPTIALADARGVFDATFLPPAKQGDVYRVVSLLRPRAVAIVDGYFQWVPSVWHKEILWAIDQGVHVFGAASMGALRAAELAAFGMHGIGRIFEAYRDGVLDCCPDEPFEDDDEVAVEHGPGEIGYVATSEAMVNIRCTLAQAEASGMIGSRTRQQCMAIAKQLFFPQRSYEALLARAQAAGLPLDELTALAAWLPNGRINQKRDDALALLAGLREFLKADPAPARATFAFEHTTLWERSLGEHAPKTLHGRDEARVLEELRLDARHWASERRDVLQSLSMSSDADGAPNEQITPARLAAEHGNPGQVSALLDELARLRDLRSAGAALDPLVIERHVLARIGATPQFAQLLARRDDKESTMAALEDLPDVDEFSDLQLLQLRDWYFTHALKEEMPDDIEIWLRDHGYRDLDHFHRAVFAEHVYRRFLIDGDERLAAAESKG